MANDVEDVVKLHHDVLDLRETTDRSLRRMEARLAKKIEGVEAAVRALGRAGGGERLQAQE